jgi:alpha/beta superfamily hydrolase
MMSPRNALDGEGPMQTFDGLTERVSFPGYRGDLLAARLDKPKAAPVAYALFAHCFTCSKDSLAAVGIARALASRGIAVLRFDFTGLGGSEGEFANTNFSSNVEDLRRAAEFLRKHYQAPALLVGHSFGGPAVLVAAADIPEAKAVATIGAPCSPAHLRRLLVKVEPRIGTRDEVEIRLGGRSFRIRSQFLKDLDEQRLLSAIRDLRRALLVFHAPKDEVVEVDRALRLFDAAVQPKTFVALEGADHLLSREEDARYVSELLAAWARRYLVAP